MNFQKLEIHFRQPKDSSGDALQNGLDVVSGVLSFFSLGCKILAFRIRVLPWTVQTRFHGYLAFQLSY